MKATVTGVDGYNWVDGTEYRRAFKGDVIEVSADELVRVDGALTKGDVAGQVAAEQAAAEVERAATALTVEEATAAAITEVDSKKR